MKKIFSLTAAIVVFALASCSKDRVCECSYTSTNPNETPYTEKYTMVDVSKKSARANCFSAKQDDNSSGTNYTYTRTCEIK
ncbi:MAG: hypothetical protein ACK5D5_08155 [Bacteroidota bacterium]|jgi:hypothetical protein